jgi:hypothetical protein
MSAEIPDGAVIVARAILNSSLWKMRPEDRVVAMTCLALCNKRPKKWFDGLTQITIHRGQFVRSREQMAKACEMPVQIVRTSIEHLEECEFLTRNLTRAYTLYTVPKYEHYQDLTKYSDSGVRKPTRDLTRSQPGKSAKSNPEFAQADERNPSDQQPLAKVLTNCGQNLTREKQKTNHKQQHTTKSASGSAAKPDRKGPRTAGSAVVVSEKTDWLALEKISSGISIKLLESVEMAKSVAASLASQKTVGQVLRAIQQARRQKKPGGWARMALEGDWTLPDPDGPELQEILGLMKIASERRENCFKSSLAKDGVSKRLPGEDESTWFKRVNDDLKRRKEADRDSGRKAQKTT